MSGLEAKDAGQVLDAARQFDQAFRGLAPEQQSGEMGATLAVDEAHPAYGAAYDESGSVELLHADRDLLRAFVSAVEAAGAAPGVVSSARAKRELATVERLIRMHEQSAEPVPAPVVEPTPIDEPTPQPEPTTQPEPPTPTPQSPASRSRDGAGLGLAVGGTTLAVAGLGTAIAGPLMVVWGNSQYSQAVLDDPSPSVDQFLRDRRTERTIMLAVGIPTFVVGAALATYGIVRLKRNRKGTAAARTVQPVIGLDGSVGLAGRF